MSKAVQFDYSKALAFIGQHEIDYLADQVRAAHDQLHNGTGAGSDYLGWIDLPTNYDKEEFARIQQAAAKIKSDSEVLIVIGIGGSYLGARAAIEMLSHSFYNILAERTAQNAANSIRRQQYQLYIRVRICCNCLKAETGRST